MNRSDGIIVPSTDKPCAFCDYLSGARPYTIAARSGLVAVMVTREQRGMPHLLVLPVRHSETLVDATDDESRELMGALRDASRAISRAFRPSGIAVWQNNGTSAHQAIPHLHFHIAGTLPGGGTDWGEVPEAALSVTDELGQQLRPLLEPRRWARADSRSAPNRGHAGLGEPGQPAIDSTAVSLSAEHRSRTEFGLDAHRGFRLDAHRGFRLDWHDHSARVRESPAPNAVSLDGGMWTGRLADFARMARKPARNLVTHIPAKRWSPSNDARRPLPTGPIRTQSGHRRD